MLNVCACIHSWDLHTFPTQKLFCAFKASIFHQQQIDTDTVQSFQKICSFTQFSPSLHEFLCHFTKHSNAHTKLKFLWQHSLNPKLTLRDFISVYLYFNLQFKFFFLLVRDFFFTELIKRSQIKSSTSLNIFSTPFNFHW